MSAPIYLDYQATTPVDPRVLEEMLPYFGEIYGNAASRSHAFGWQAEEAVGQGRERIAHLIGASAKEIVFTSGSTEGINLAMKGVAQMYGSKGKHIITSQAEHKAVLDTAKRLEKDGFEVTYLAPDSTGRHSAEQVAEALREDTILVTIMWANNEIGSINPIREIGAVCKERGVLFFTDGTQAVGKLPVDVEADNVDLLCLSGHKLYGPKGVGALYVRRRNPRVRLVAQMDGGGHERGMRSGTLNVPAIVGLGKAAELCVEQRDAERARLTALRDKMFAAFEALEEVYLNGHPTQRLPGALNVSFNFVEGESLMMGMKGICVSSGSACTSATLEPSHVMRALGVGEDLVHTSIRFSLGRFTTEDDVDEAIARCSDAALKLRDMSPLWEMFKEGIDLNAIEWKHD